MVQARPRSRASSRGSTGLTYVYGQGGALLLPVLSRTARRVLGRRRGTPTSPAYYATVRSVGKRHRRLTRLYCLVWLLESAWVTRRRIRGAQQRGRPVILDRGYLDTVVNVAVMRGDSTAAMLRTAAQLERLAPCADRHLFLDVSETVALARQPGCPSLAYLADRRSATAARPGTACRRR